MGNVNYLSVVPQTFDERVAIYMKSKKEDLVKMLAESAKYTNPEGRAELRKNNPDLTLESVSFIASMMD